MRPASASLPTPSPRGHRYIGIIGAGLGLLLPPSHIMDRLILELIRIVVIPYYSILLFIFFRVASGDGGW